MKRIALALLVALVALVPAPAFDTRKEPVGPDGTRAAVDIPGDQHMTNTGGSDGFGLCVPTSVTVAARWQNVTDAYKFRAFTESRLGGSWPEKLAADLKTYSTRYGVTLPAYVQHTGGDVAFLDLCYATRRSPCMTYAGKDNFYSSGIAHMVTGAHLDAKWGAIIDNNRAGSWVWMTRPQKVARWLGKNDDGTDILVPVQRGVRTYWTPVGGGWAFVWLTPPPPPKPPSAAQTFEEKPPAVPVVVWERRIVQGFPLWFNYIGGELAWVIDHMGEWHKATGPDAWESEAQPAPDGVEPPKEPEPTAGWNNGIDVHRVPRVCRYWINDVECCRVKAFAAVADPGGLLDDSDKYHLSVVGDKKAVAALFAPGGSCEKYARRVHVQVYDATDWVAKDRLSSVVTLQEPAKISGKVVASSADAGEAGIKKVLGDVFDPPVKPEPKPDRVPVPTVPVPVPWAWIVVGVLALVIIWRNK